jgi:EmrB/QacA subfamily drug resistance transporter
VDRRAAGASPGLRLGTPSGRWVIAAAVLGSGVAFLDGTVVNAALPSIARSLDAGLADLQWVLTGYLLTLGSLLVIGGSLGDLYGRRRVFMVGLCGFAGASLLCGLAPSVGVLVGMRALQGIAAALLVPGSLAIISSSFRLEDRAPAIGAWSGLSGVSLAIGPFVGGWLIDAVSWRLVFLVNVPLVAAAMWITARHVPETRAPSPSPDVDYLGGIVLALGLGTVVYALIEGPAQQWPPLAIVCGAIGVLALAAWFVVEARSSHPMVPLSIFRSRQFSGANAVTFVVYAALGGVMFFLVVYLQTGLGYSALEAGASLVPLTVLMLLFSSRAGTLAQRIGPRLPMTVGPVAAGLGMFLLTRVEPGVSYWEGVFPGVVVLASGVTLTVAPLTATVLGAIDDAHAGIASAINNAVARIAGLLAVALLPAAAGLAGVGGALELSGGFDRAMVICGALAVSGGVLSWITIRRVVPVAPLRQVAGTVSCEDPCVREHRAA